MREMRRRFGPVAALVTLAAGLALTGAGYGAVAATSSAPLAAGTLDLQGILKLISVSVACPPEAPPGADECRARTGKGVIPGLGRATEIYLWFDTVGPPTCPAGEGKPLATTGRLIVEGKGEIGFALAEGAECVDQDPIRLEAQSFTITGGTSIYEGASGSGTLERNVSNGVGNETWAGTLAVPGLEFDVTPPTLSGARSKTVRAPRRATRVRVTYKVTAIDAVDGHVRAACAPRSGARFPIGRTFVWCEATDSSGNAAEARFTVRVKRRR
jgi:hypothetical protein